MIPKKIHAVFGMMPDFGGKPFSLVHYLAVKSAAVTNDCTVELYYGFEPSGVWWERAKEYARLHHVEPPTQIAGVSLRHPAHQTDVLRLFLLRDQGGITLDLDVICLKPFAPLLEHEVVLAYEEPDSTVAICNAVMLAKPGAEFIDRWIDGYDPKKSLWQGFRSAGFDKYWGEMSTRYPAHLAGHFPTGLTILASSSFFPFSWRQQGISALFREVCPVGTVPAVSAYCVHLWEMVAWKEFLGDLSVEGIMSGDSAFAALARPFVADEKPHTTSVDTGA